MKYQKGFAPLLLIIFIVAGTAAAGGYVMLKDKKQETKMEETAQNPQSSQDDSKEEITVTQVSVPVVQKAESVKSIPSTWETYKNDEFGFSFKHPSEFRIDSSSSEELLSLNIKNDLVKEFLFILAINLNPESAVRTETFQETCDKYRKAEEMEGKLLECKKVIINEQEYIKVVQEVKTTGGIGTTLIDQSPLRAFIAVVYIPPSHKGEFSDAVDDILSTIKF